MGVRKQKIEPAMAPPDLVKEACGGTSYEYYALGEYVVAARGVCGGRPTIKYHRLDARHVVGRLRRGDSPEQIAQDYKIPLAAVDDHGAGCGLRL